MLKITICPGETLSAASFTSEGWVLDVGELLTPELENLSSTNCAMELDAVDGPPKLHLALLLFPMIKDVEGSR